MKSMSLQPLLEAGIIHLGSGTLKIVYMVCVWGGEVMTNGI
jgi:hypothetical protein